MNSVILAYLNKQYDEKIKTLSELIEKANKVIDTNSKNTKFFICDNINDYRRIIESADRLYLKYDSQRMKESLWHITIYL